jgi:hypothetical protein
VIVTETLRLHACRDNEELYREGIFPWTVAEKRQFAHFSEMFRSSGARPGAKRREEKIAWNSHSIYAALILELPGPTDQLPKPVIEKRWCRFAFHEHCPYRPTQYGSIAIWGGELQIAVWVA